MAELLQVGRIDKAHGLRGEVVVTLITERTERLAPGSQLESDRGPLVVEAARRHQRRWIVAFAGVGSREAAEELRGTHLRAEPLDDADGDALWVHELVGADVRTADGRSWGRVEAVEENPASDLLVLAGGALVPVVFVSDRSGLGGADPHVVVDPPEGLLEG